MPRNDRKQAQETTDPLHGKVNCKAVGISPNEKIVIYGTINNINNPSVQKCLMFPGIKFQGEEFECHISLTKPMEQNLNAVNFIRHWLPMYGISFVSQTYQNAIATRLSIENLQSSIMNANEPEPPCKVFFYNFLSKVSAIYFGQAMNIHIESEMTPGERRIWSNHA